MTTSVQQIEALYQRLQRAREIVADGKVFPIVGMDDHYTVQGTAGHYLVNEHCTCQDAQQPSEMHHGWCKHKLSVELYKETQEASAPPEKPKRKKEKADTSETPEEGFVHRTTLPRYVTVVNLVNASVNYVQP